MDYFMFKVTEYNFDFIWYISFKKYRVSFIDLSEFYVGGTMMNIGSYIR